MAEFAAIVGVGASILQVIDACYKVKSRIDAFTKDIAFQDVALQLELFAKDLEHIAQSDLPRQEQDAQAADGNPILKRVLDGCQRQLDKLNQLLSEIVPDPASSRTQKTLQAVKTFGKDTKVRRLMQTLAEYKSAINLHVSTRIYTKDAIVQSPSRSKTYDSLPQYKDIPNRRVARFVGRQDLLLNIQNATNPNPKQPTTVVLTGLGGQGKTQTALEFCDIARDNYDIIFWINASSRKTVTLDLSRLYDALMASRGKSDPEGKARYIIQRLSYCDVPWLLVFDNYDRPDLFDLTEFIPPSKTRPWEEVSTGKILITSRSRECARLGNHRDLQGLTDEEAVELLAYRSGCNAESDPDRATARQIVSRLGHLPLAIDQASSYISTRDMTLSIFLDHYEQRRAAVMNHVPKCSWQYKNELSEATPSAETLSVFTTWEMSAANISDDPVVRESVLQFLTIAANFNGQRIDEELYRTHFTPLSPEAGAQQWDAQCVTDGQWDSYAYQDLVVGLASISLIQKFQFEDDTLWFTLHPLIQDWLQLRSSLEAQQQMLAYAIAMTASVVHLNESQGFSLAKRRTYMQHVDSALSSVRYFLKTENAKIQYSGFIEGHQSIFATFYEENDRFDDAEKLFAESYRLQLQYLGPSSLATLATQNNLANLYIKTGRLDMAEQCLLEVIKIKESTIGLYDERTLNSVNNLGNLYSTQNKLLEAKYMYSRALTGYAALLSEKHRRTRAAASNLAEINVRMGDFYLAEQLFQRALEVEPHVAQGQCFETCDSLHYHVLFQLAEFKLKQGDTGSALKLLHETVEGRSRLFGKNHSSTLAAMFRFDRALGKIEDPDKPPPYEGHGYYMIQSPATSKAFQEVKSLEKKFEGFPQNGHATGYGFTQPQEQAGWPSKQHTLRLRYENRQYPLSGTMTNLNFTQPQEQALKQPQVSPSYVQPQEQTPLDLTHGFVQPQEHSPVDSCQPTPRYAQQQQQGPISGYSGFALSNGDAINCAR